ncbi:MAG: STAS domain-containing protein [Bacteroidales bacterium]|nr:STAS domain-containing protein [Bacteroidales bacterium]
MEIKEQKIKDVIVLEILGRVDTTNYGKLEGVLSDYIAKNEKNIIIDCSEMDYISSSGLRVFLTGFKKINAINGNYFLCGLQDNIQEIFEISGFTSIFKIFTNQENALKGIE